MDKEGKLTVLKKLLFCTTSHYNEVYDEQLKAIIKQEMDALTYAVECCEEVAYRKANKIK